MFKNMSNYARILAGSYSKKKRRKEITWIYDVTEQMQTNMEPTCLRWLTTYSFDGVYEHNF